MAVSGRKISDFQGSVSKSSAEDFDHSCEPCLTTGQYIEAEGYCVNCREYLCKSCFTYHQRLKANRHHRLLDKKSMPRHALPNKDSKICTESCSVHRNEIIKYFCTQHEILGCTDCITLHHRTCNLDYIPDKCADIGESTEYKEIMQNLNQKVKEIEEVMETATARDKEIDTCHDNIMKEVIKLRKEINDRLDQLQNKIQADAEKIKSTDKKNVKSVLEECTTVSSEMKQYLTSLQDNKTSGLNGQLYISVKQARSYLKSVKVEKVEQNLAKTDMQYRFERNQDLEKMLSKQSILGNLRLSPSRTALRKQKRVYKLTPKGNINVRTKSDRNECCISGCAVLSSNKFILSDFLNKNLKVVDKDKQSVIEEKTLDSKPYDIAVLPNDHIAVTLPDKKEIRILTANGKLSTIRRLSVPVECKGIDYHRGQFYLVCWDPDSVLILDTQGNVQNTISLDKEIFNSPNYILFNETSRQIYISNYNSNAVVSITLQGEITAVSKQNDLRGPVGMMMLDDGALLVCCNGTIHHVSGDLKQSKTMIDGLHSLQTICYNHHQQEVYIGSEFLDELKVFSLK